MKILVLGGTGAMGVPLVKILAKDHDVYVTSRREHASDGSVHYIKGNGMNTEFVERLLTKHQFDTVIDFMVRTETGLRNLIDTFLSNTGQYVFISSARVYAQSDEPIIEETPRLLDVSKDKQYLNTHEYSLEKAREEDMLLKSGRNNFTIIRPSITYNDYRLQLGVFEKEEWLFRAMHGRTIVFSNDLKNKLTTMTHGDDVARGIASIVGKNEALGKAFHITSPVSLTWYDILKIYVAEVEKYLGKPVKIIFTDKSTNFKFPEKKYQLIYCRYFNRTFDNSQINKYIDTRSFKTPEDGLKTCINNFLKKPKFNSINATLEAIHDSITDEKTSFNEFNNIYSSVCYILQKNHLGRLIKPMRNIIKYFIK